MEDRNGILGSSPAVFSFPFLFVPTLGLKISSSRSMLLISIHQHHFLIIQLLIYVHMLTLNVFLTIFALIFTKHSAF